VAVRLVGTSATGGGVKTISCPPEHSMPEGIKLLECGRVRGKVVAAIGKDREDSSKN